jgi:hypothetical protein
MSGSDAQVDYEDEQITFRAIWHAAEVLRQHGEKDESRGFWHSMAATTMLHVAYEGFVNDLIERLWADEWKIRAHDKANRGTQGKTAFIAGRLGVTFSWDMRPYRSIKELATFRHALVHPRTVRVSGTTSATVYATQPIRARPQAFAALESPNFIEQCFADIESVGDALLTAAVAKHGRAVGLLGSRAFCGVLGGGGASLKRS